MYHMMLMMLEIEDALIFFYIQCVIYGNNDIGTFEDTWMISFNNIYPSATYHKSDNFVVIFIISS